MKSNIRYLKVPASHAEPVHSRENSKHQLGSLFAGLQEVLAILSVEFFRRESWSGLPFPFPGDLPNPGIKLMSPAWQADSLYTEPSEKP